MPPPNKSTSARPHDLKVSVVRCHPEWKKPSNGRHHVFLFDGTWNDRTGINPVNFNWDNARNLWVSRADPTKAHPPVVTNVVKTHLALAADGPTQLTHYFRGVGNDDEHDSPNVLAHGASAHDEPYIRRHAYCEFLSNYRDGDQISILGFSRGAATARLFARDLGTYGLLETLMIESRYTRLPVTGDLRHQVWTIWPKKSKKLIPGADIPIAFLGVWDTVSTSMAASEEDWEVPSTVKRAVHCVALDETRVLFEPTLMTFPAKRADRVKEVWFPGVHSDIGGGYYCDALGRVTLDFVWRNWNSAVECDGDCELTWRPKIAAAYSSVTGLPWLRHSQVKADQKWLVAPRRCVAAHGAKPRVHPSVERFVQQGGLQFCEELGGDFPPKCVVSGAVYQPIAYPGRAAVELYDSTSWKSGR